MKKPGGVCEAETLGGRKRFISDFEAAVSPLLPILRMLGIAMSGPVLVAFMGGLPWGHYWNNICV